MTSAPGGQGRPPTNVSISMPPERVTGVHADFVSAWHTQDVFVLDFAAVVAPGRPAEGADGQPVTQLDAQVVARVKLPPSQVFEVMKALEKQLSSWEAQTGRRPAPPTD